MTELISKQLLLASYHNGVGIQIKSLELSWKLPVRLCAEQAVKTPLEPLKGSGDSAKRDKVSQGKFSDLSENFLKFSEDFWKIFHWEICAGAVNDGRPTRCALRRDDRKIGEF